MMNQFSDATTNYLIKNITRHYRIETRKHVWKVERFNVSQDIYSHSLILIFDFKNEKNKEKRLQYKLDIELVENNMTTQSQLISEFLIQSQNTIRKQLEEPKRKYRKKRYSRKYTIYNESI